MYSEPRHTDNGEAMAHNRRVEQAREAEHQRRCDQSPAYKRVYQRWQQTMTLMGRQQAQVASVIQEAVSTQRVSDTMDNIESQPVRRFCEKMAAHGNGIALLVNRQDNLLWQEVIFPTAASMIFMRHRVKFIQPDGRSSSPFFGSCLVAWGRECDRRLRQSDIEGKYVVLNL